MANLAAWLWPDRIIGKRESRQLREQYNRCYNERCELLQVLSDLRTALRENRKLDVRKDFSLMAADAAAGTAIHKVTQ